MKNFIIAFSVILLGGLGVLAYTNDFSEKETAPEAFTPMISSSCSCSFISQFPLPSDNGNSTSDGLDVDGNGNIISTEDLRDEVNVFSNNGTFLQNIWVGIPGTGSGTDPYGVKVLSDGRILVSDELNGFVAIFNSSYTYIGQLGTKGSGDGQFEGPRGIFEAANGDILVVDGNNNRVQVFDGTTLAYKSQFGMLGFSGGANELFSPIGIGQSPINGRIYVTNNNQYVQIFNADYTYHSNFSVPTLLSKDILFHPTSGRFLLTQAVSFGVHPLLALYDSNNSFICEVGSYASPGGMGTFTDAAALAFASNGDILFTDAANELVHRFSGVCLQASDTDNDGIPDPIDNCPNTSSAMAASAGFISDCGTNAGTCGCTDEDMDGKFPDKPAGDPNYDPDDACDQIPVGSGSCMVADSDMDGVPDSDDNCPNTTPAMAASAGFIGIDFCTPSSSFCGCTDADADGKYPDKPANDPDFDPDDNCNQIPNGIGNCDDDDNDGIPNFEDDCPNTTPEMAASDGFIGNCLAFRCLNCIENCGCTDVDGDGKYPDKPANDPDFDPDDSCNQIPEGSGACKPEIAISDPCNCLQGINLDGGNEIELSRDIITITAESGQTITLTSPGGLLDETGNPASGIATDNGFGTYSFTGYVPADGVSTYTAVFTVSGGGPNDGQMVDITGGPCNACLEVPTMGQWAFFLFGLVLFTLAIVGVYNVYQVDYTVPKQ